jgi:hypothetical protein
VVWYVKPGGFSSGKCVLSIKRAEKKGKLKRLQLTGGAQKPENLRGRRKVLGLWAKGKAARGCLSRRK